MPRAERDPRTTGRRETSGAIIDGTRIAATVRAEVALKARRLEALGTAPGLAAVLVGEDAASALYVRNKERACAEVGIRAMTFRLAATVSEGELLGLVGRLNRDESVHGIIVQLPVPPHISPGRVACAIAPEKDVDGAHPATLGRLAQGSPTFIPPTPLGIQELLRRSGIPVQGRHMVVCGRSNLVGRPAALLFLQKAAGANATVTVCHTGTPRLGEFTRQADILVAAMGQARAITADMVKEGVVVVDVGINRVEDPAAPRGYRFVGDVDFEAVRERASAITPVPGGVGPMTVAMLLHNTILAASRRATSAEAGMPAP